MCRAEALGLAPRPGPISYQAHFGKAINPLESLSPPL